MITEQAIRESVERELAAYGCVRCEAAIQIDQAATNKRKRCVSGVASVEEVSRTGLLIRIEGLDVTRYNRDNPVVLAQHQAVAMGTLMPGAIGTIERVSKKDKTLAFKNMTFDTDPLAEAWWQKVSKGIVRMVSVGVIPRDWQYVEEPPKKGETRGRYYLEFMKSELLEISVVAVGANRGALITPPPAAKDESAEAVAELMQRVEALTARVAEFERITEQLEERKQSAVARLLQAAERFNGTVH